MRPARQTLAKLLRELRQRHGLTLREVAAASEAPPFDSAGRVSQPYLAQLEGGRAARPSLTKLLTLAALYRVAPVTLISAADNAEQLRAQYAKWTKLPRGTIYPTPLFFLRGADRARLDAEFDRTLASKAPGVAVPLNAHESALVRLRQVATAAALLPYLTTANRGLFPQFLELFAAPSMATKPSAQNPAVEIDGWRVMAEQFVNWIFYQQNAAPALAALIQEFHYDFSSQLAACTFADPELNAAFAFAAVPADLLCDLRHCQLAQLLKRDAPADTPPAPAPLEAVRTFLHSLSDPRLRYHCEPPLHRYVVSLYAHLAAHVPALAPMAEPPGAAGAVRLLTTADAQVARVLAGPPAPDRPPPETRAPRTPPPAEPSTRPRRRSR